jgi:hypothetical protein
MRHFQEILHRTIYTPIRRAFPRKNNSLYFKLRFNLIKGPNKLLRLSPFWVTTLVVATQHGIELRRVRGLIKVLSQHVAGGIEETHGKPQDNLCRNQDTNQETP